MTWTLPVTAQSRRGGGMSAAEFITGLENVRKYHDGWIAKCPSCDKGKRQTLVVNERDDRILLHCYRGCSAMDVVEAMGLKLSDLFNDREPTDPIKKHEFHQMAKAAKAQASMNAMLDETTRLRIQINETHDPDALDELLQKYHMTIAATLHEAGALK